MVTFPFPQPPALFSLDISHPTSLSQTEFLISGRLKPFLHEEVVWSVLQVSALKSFSKELQMEQKEIHNVWDCCVFSRGAAEGEPFPGDNQVEKPCDP